MSHIEQARGCLPTAAHHREAVIGKTFFCFNWPRAYSLLLTPTAFDEPVSRLPVASCFYCDYVNGCYCESNSYCEIQLLLQKPTALETETSNHDFKLLTPVLRVLLLLHLLPLLRVLLLH